MGMSMHSLIESIKSNQIIVVRSGLVNSTIYKSSQGEEKIQHVILVYRQ
jgi:hypothetical protein